MEIINQILDNLSGIIGSLIILAKIIYDNRGKRLRDAEIDEKQTKRINSLDEKLDKHIIDEKENTFKLLDLVSKVQKSTDDLNELHKHNRKLPEILQKLDKEFENIKSTTKIDNDEFIQMLFQTKTSLKEFASLVLSQDFKNIEINEVTQVLESKAKLLKSTVSFKKLNLKDPAKFMSEIKLKTIIPLISIFAINLNRILIKKTNGIRRQAFEDLLINHLQKMLFEIIEKYKFAEKTKHI